jgi:hypothetical protein
MIVVAEIVAGHRDSRKGGGGILLAWQPCTVMRGGSADRDANRRVRQATRATGCPRLQGGVHRLIAS